MSEVRVGSSKDLVTVTDELRRMLDERGVHWRAVEDERKTLWESNGLTWEYFNNENGDAWLGFLGACEQDVTPEQAIAATLGTTDAKPTEAESSGTCRNVAVPDEYSDRPFTCSECGARGPMGNGTYHLASSWAMEDGTLAFADSWPVWKYCPNCGRRVVDPTADGADAEVTDG